MCDCYSHKCERCETLIPMHLSDFITGRDEIEVFCPEHIPLNRNDGCLWFIVDNDDYDEELKGKNIFVRSLTDNARANYDGNSPNVYNDILVEKWGKAV